MQVLAFLAASFLTVVRVKADGQAQWYCHPQGGSCVAAEAGGKPPYPPSKQAKAWVTRSGDAFTTARECRAARDGRCRSMTAAQALAAEDLH